MLLSAWRVNITGSKDRRPIEKRSCKWRVITGDQNIKTCAFRFHRTPPFFSWPRGKHCPSGRSCLQFLPSSTATAEQSSRQRDWRLSLSSKHRGSSTRISPLCLSTRPSTWLASGGCKLPEESGYTPIPPSLGYKQKWPPKKDGTRIPALICGFSRE